MAEVRTVLDFGCGCGRTLQWWLRQPHPPELYGTDVDAETVAWVKANLPVHAGTNAPTPPLAYADGLFDVVYSISVFTHLDATFQDAWLRELERVLKPGGLALFSVRSPMDSATLPPPLRAEMDRRGSCSATTTWCSATSRNSITAPIIARAISSSIRAASSRSSAGCRWVSRT